MLSGIASLGVEVPTGLIDDQHRMGAGIDGGTDLDEVRRHGVGVAPGHDQPGGFPLRGTDRAEDIGPFGALVAGRPRARATSEKAIGVIDARSSNARAMRCRRIWIATMKLYRRVDHAVRRGSFF